MNAQMKTIAFLFTALALVSTSVQAAALEPNAKVESQGKEAIKKQEQKAAELKKLINQDVSKGLEKVGQAVKALDEQKAKDGLSLLKEAVGSFEVALAADPKLNLVPVSSVVEAQTLYTNPDSLRRELAYARELLGEGRVQEARTILKPLRSDIAVHTTHLPMKSYPDAIRKAIKALVDGKPEEAKGILAAAMRTLVVTEEIAAPVPLITAMSLVDAASKMDRQKKDEVLASLQMAKDQLDVANLLGYLPEDAKQYKEMRERIQKIESEVRGENKATAMYKDLKDALAKWLPWSG
jgi:hypothetical protein